VIFSSNIIKTPKSSGDEAYKKREKEKRKAPRVSSNKRESQYFERRKIVQLKKSFWCDSIFYPSIIPFQKPFPKSMRKFS
jgi:hypothetical protein